jgi:ABC-type nickel/cobalt efflux system permease component RcnA
MHLPGAVNATRRPFFGGKVSAMDGLSVSATLLLGLLLGLRHALDADHVAAVTTIAGGRGGLRQSALVGLAWGLGHALSLAIVGGTLLALRVEMPGRVSRLFELAVALMLIGLGAAALAGLLRHRLHVHEHEHDGAVHAHLHFHAAPHGEGSHHRHPHPLRRALRPFLVGGLHGLAGTGALVLLVMTTLPTVLLGLVYLGVFGAGSVAGMVLVSLAIGAPLAIASRRAGRLYGLLRAAAGLGSLGLGLRLAWTIGVEQGLLR